MDIINKIIQNVPLFRHCTNEEMQYLRRIGRISVIKKGQFFDLKSMNSFNVIINGIFEIEALGKTDIVYLSPGSFFGTIPFTNNRHRGTIKAIVDSTLILFNIEDIYKFFLVSYKGLRGYLKTVDKMGFEISDIGNKYFGNNSRIISVYSSYENSGKTFFASLLGLSLTKHGKTIILDLSYSGNSVFNYFEKKITSPISHKQVDAPSVEKLINEKIVNVSDNLDLINISFGSKVKVNKDILSPILFILSKEYKYILIDISDYDIELRNKTFELSDTIFPLLKNQKDMSKLYDTLDSYLKEGQRVYYVVNEYYAGDVRNFTGGLILQKFQFTSNAGYYSNLVSFLEGSAIENIVALVVKRKKSLVLETNFLDSIFFSGFITALSKLKINFDFFYTSSLSYIMLSLYLLSTNDNDFRKKIVQFFSEDKINKMLDITFPNEHIFKNNGISKFAEELSGNKRIEIFENVPVVMLSEEGMNERRLFSTGYARDMISASFLVYPIFESKNIVNSYFNSGYPSFRVRVEDLFRTDMDDIVYVSVYNKSKLKYSDGKILRFYDKYVAFMGQKYYDDKVSDLADNNFVVEVSEKDIKVEKILELTENISNKLLKEKGI